MVVALPLPSKHPLAMVCKPSVKMVLLPVLTTNFSKSSEYTLPLSSRYCVLGSEASESVLP